MTELEQHDQSALKWAEEEASHPINKLFESLRERVANERTRVDSLIAVERLRLDAIEKEQHNKLQMIEDVINSEQATHAAHTAATVAFVRQSMLDLAAAHSETDSAEAETEKAAATIKTEADKRTEAIQQVIERAPTAANLARALAAAQTAPAPVGEPPAEPVAEAPAPEPLAPDAEAPRTGDEGAPPPAFLRRPRDITAVRMAVIMAAATLLACGATLWSSATAARSCMSLSACKAEHAGYCRYKARNGDRCWYPAGSAHLYRTSPYNKREIPKAAPPAKRNPIAAASINVNAYDDPIWYSPLPLTRIDGGFEALAPLDQRAY